MMTNTATLPPLANPKPKKPLSRNQLAESFTHDLRATYDIANFSPVCTLLNGSPEDCANFSIYRWLILEAELPERSHLTNALRRRVHYQFRVALRLINRMKIGLPA